MIKFLEENLGQCLWDFGLGKSFKHDTESGTQKGKNDKLDFLKIISTYCQESDQADHKPGEGIHQTKVWCLENITNSYN